MQVHGKPATQRWTAGTTLLAWMMLVWTLFDMVLFAALRFDTPWLGVVLQSCILAQFATLAGWLALGDGNLLVRTICLAVVALIGELMVRVAASAVDSWWPQIGQTAAMLVASIIMLSLPLFVASLFGWRCRLADDRRTDGRPFQFRIAQVLVATAIVAALLGLWRVLPDHILGSMMFAAVSSLVVAPLIASQWILQLRPRPGLVWYAALLVAAVYWLTTIVMFHRDPSAIASLVLYAAALGVNLALFRAWGYRLLRRNELVSE
jgi:hypothetical protein